MLPIATNKPNVYIPLTDIQEACLVCGLQTLTLTEYKSAIYNVDCGIDYYSQYEEILAALLFNSSFEGSLPSCINSDNANAKIQSIIKKYCSPNFKPCRTC